MSQVIGTLVFVAIFLPQLVPQLVPQFMNVASAQSPFASSTVAPVPKGSSLKAFELAREKKWPEARTEAINSTKTDPGDAKAWLMLGVIEERAENLSESEAAYRKYLAMNPNSKMSGAVQTKLQEVTVRAKTKSEAIWGPGSNGFFFGYSPMVATDGVSKLNSSLKSSFDIGFSSGNHFFGLRRGTGTVASFRAPLKGVPNTNTYTTVGPADLTFNEIFYTGYVTLVAPYEKWNGLTLTMPMSIGGYGYVINAPGSRNFDNLGYDFAAGFALKWFTRSSLTIEISSLYHLGLPLWELRESSDSKAIRAIGSTEDLAGQISGVEFRVGIGFLFGSETTGHF